MCFSAPVSFGAAALLTGIGVATLSKARTVREMPLAAMPLLFGAQQGIEGVLWLTVPAGHAAGTFWASLFAMIALVLWPLLVPLAFALVERSPKRRRWISALMIPGLAAAVYGIASILAHPYRAWPDHLALTYINGEPYPLPLAAQYLASVVLPPLLSTDRTLRLIGLVVVAGLAVALLFFLVDAVSVWCFFSALASMVLLWRFAAAPPPSAGGTPGSTAIAPGRL